jgi:hypothetical protein
MAWRAFIDGWGNGQPAGRRLLHRRTDGMAGVTSTSPLQTRYVPVGLMYYEGVARLVAAGVSMPSVRHVADPGRVALEGYPRRLAHTVVGRRSYKNSELPDRATTRADILGALEAGSAGLPFLLRIEAALRRAVLDDNSGDRLDAVLCLAQAAQASMRPDHGLPSDIDPVEGWIVGP